jgi:hypothetical protein
MGKNVGIQLNGDYDLEIAVRRDENERIISGLVVGDVTYQNQAMILKAQKGEFKENPAVGAGIEDIVNDNDLQLWRKEIAEQLEADGQRIDRLVLNEKEFILDAKYQ